MVLCLLSVVAKHKKSPGLNLTRNAAAVVLGDEVAVVVRADGVVVRQLDHLLESVINKDEADES